MSAVDTNVLVRLVIQDDQRQVEAVARLKRDCACQQQTLFVSTTVVLEFEWVLRSCFKLDKGQVLAAFQKILGSGEVTLQAQDAVVKALKAYRDSSADLADCIHTALAAAEGRSPLHTFDRRASRLTGARLLG